MEYDRQVIPKKFCSEMCEYRYNTAREQIKQAKEIETHREAIEFAKNKKKGFLYDLLAKYNTWRMLRVAKARNRDL